MRFESRPVTRSQPTLLQRILVAIHPKADYPGTPALQSLTGLVLGIKGSSYELHDANRLWRFAFFDPRLSHPCLIAGTSADSTASNEGDFGIGFTLLRYLCLSQDVDRGENFMSDEKKLQQFLGKIIFSALR